MADCVADIDLQKGEPDWKTFPSLHFDVKLDSFDTGIPFYTQDAMQVSLAHSQEVQALRQENLELRAKVHSCSDLIATLVEEKKQVQCSHFHEQAVQYVVNPNFSLPPDLQHVFDSVFQHPQDRCKDPEPQQSPPSPRSPPLPACPVPSAKKRRQRRKGRSQDLTKPKSHSARANPTGMVTCKKGISKPGNTPEELFWSLQQDEHSDSEGEPCIVLTQVSRCIGNSNNGHNLLTQFDGHFEDKGLGSPKYFTVGSTSKTAGPWRFKTHMHRTTKGQDATSMRVKDLELCTTQHPHGPRLSVLLEQLMQARQAR